ncbi:MAG: XRE family transcriptional regulator [Actinobacteria bacterium]|nr:MAG: XRE family transcriptional regulator [Actinomycetota bacterium]
MANLCNSFGLEIRKEREKARLSQEKLAELMQIHRTYLSKLELGKVCPTLRVAEKAAKALELKLSVIISRIE